MIQRGRIGVKRTASARLGPDAVSTSRRLRPFASGNATCDLGPGNGHRLEVVPGLNVVRQGRSMTSFFMNMRRFSRETQRNYLRDIGRLATFSGVHHTRRPPTTCAGPNRAAGGWRSRSEDEQVVSALRFFFTQTLGRPDLARRLVRLAHPRNLPVGAEPRRGCPERLVEVKYHRCRSKVNPPH